MSQNENDKLMDHDYDGIQELNNPLPRWWLLTFYATIVFAFGYYVYYEVMDGPTSEQYLEASLAEINKVQEENKKKQPAVTAINVEEILADSEKVAKGKQQYTSKCAACHGVNGEGIIGPNLTDNFWLHGDGKSKSVLKVIKEGVVEKGMPAWDQLIPEDEQTYLTAYIISLKGTNPANGKAPQGNKVD